MFFTIFGGPPISADPYIIATGSPLPLAPAVLSSAPYQLPPPTPHGSLWRRRFNLELLMNSIGNVQVGILVLLFSYDSCGINILWCFAAITLMFNDHLEWLWWAARGSQPVFSIFCALDLCVIWCAEVRGGPRRDKSDKLKLTFPDPAPQLAAGTQRSALFVQFVQFARCGCYK